ncbi:MAG TPA: orotidine-5'-phosphate decarboxylase [Verrucomicrobiae bacterium]|jgi:orotidine-5'-phosphate decarboxylase
MESLLSAKSIPPSERLIVALDVANGDLARKLVNELGDSVSFYKVGLEMLMSGDFFDLVQWLRERGKHVFADIKFFDVPETVKKAMSQVKRLGVTFVTAHGNDDILRAAVEVKGDAKILAVTVLTSLDKNDLADLGFACDVEALVLSRARRAFALGCDGVISSGLEASKLRTTLGGELLIVTPGIRAFSNLAVRDDQKRTVTAEEAFIGGADYIVVGRPITKSDQPKAQAEQMQETIRRLFRP